MLTTDIDTLAAAKDEYMQASFISAAQISQLHRS